MTFLKAEWLNLALVNYKIDPKILEPYVPEGTELDFYNDNCYVSLVGFLFKNTKVLGFKLPSHINFEEVNLRFYVKYKDQDKWKRGVVFIKEIVPKSLITFIANTVYKEHYQTCKMNHRWIENHSVNTIEYNWKMKNKWQTVSVTSEKENTEILPDTEAEFITEHYFGYTKHNDKTFEYEVNHPRWTQFKIKNYSIHVDFGLNYGKDFEVLNQTEPISILLAQGSNIKVQNKTTINPIYTPPL